MKKIEFIKMVASGNDFIVISLSRYLVISLEKLAKKMCDRKFGVGADGLLVLEKSKNADIKIRTFNPDGSEAEMCGNGARCIALYSTRNPTHLRWVPREARNQIRIETKAGIINSEVNGENVKIKLTDPRDIKLDLPIRLSQRNACVNFINTGVPHVVIFVEGLDKIDVVNLGSQLRYHKKFAPKGTNVDFVEILSNNAIKIRTYERGVEDETLACGTGVVAGALVFSFKTDSGNEIKVFTKSGEILKVYFDKKENIFRNVWLEGKAKIVYKGVYYV